METLEKRTLKIITYEVFDFIIAEFREGLENAQIKKKKNSKNFESKRKETKLVIEVKPSTKSNKIT